MRDIPVEFPETMASHDVLASLWARARIDNLMGQDYRRRAIGKHACRFERHDYTTRNRVSVDDAVYFVRRGRGDDRD